MARWEFGDDGTLPADLELTALPTDDGSDCEDCVFGTPRFFHEAGL